MRWTTNVGVFVAGYDIHCCDCEIIYIDAPWPDVEFLHRTVEYYQTHVATQSSADCIQPAVNSR